MDDEDERDIELENAMRLTEIAHRHAHEFYNTLVEISRRYTEEKIYTPMGVDYVEEMFRCAVEEAVGEGRQTEIDPPELSRKFPYI